MLRFLEMLGIFTKNQIITLINFTKLFLDTLFWIFIAPFTRRRYLKRESIFYQMVFMGLRSIIIVFFVTFFTGFVLAMQAAYQLKQVGAVVYVASLVAVSLARELGPVLTALVVAGRVGAAITAEIGSMSVTEQLEALDTMAINPTRFLVVPRLIALFFMLPCLTIIGDFVGMFGGYLIGVLNLKINSAHYIHVTLKFLSLKDIYTGLSKSFVFAIIIAMVGCYQGLNTKGGAQGVGKATTLSVVTSFILIILADAVLTAIYYFSNI
ncbi:MAG: ABC transporter permease [Candidatus Omnitrophica bacterium]|nr:ABC transporter permease [Candidatus Omnitrophota bacterium]